MKKTYSKVKPKRKFIEKNKHINFDRESKKGNARKDVTEVVCCSCGKKCVVPFKPRKPDVYCDDCFKKK